MAYDETLEEELKRILDEGSASAQPMELADEKARLAQLGAGMTEGMGEDLPRGTKVNFTPEVVTPPASRVPMTPKVVDLTNQSPDDIEMAAARAEDRMARSREAFERGSRQLVAGLTRTQEQAAFKQPQDAVAQLLAARKTKSDDAQRNEQNRLGAAKLNYDQAEAARQKAIAEQRRKEDLEERAKDDDRAERGLKNSADNAAATREQTRALMGLRIDEADAKKQDRTDKAAAGAVPLLGGTLNMKPGLSDTDRSRAREAAGLWNAADSAVSNFQSVLEEYARNPSVESKGRVTAALRTASSAFNSAIGGGAMSEGEARAMSDAMGADVLSPSGLQAIAQSLFGDDAKAAATISSRVKAARQANRVTALGRLKTYGDYSEGSAVTAGVGGSSKNAAALAWAKAHPDDPRAAQILQKLGAQ